MPTTKPRARKPKPAPALVPPPDPEPEPEPLVPVEVSVIACHPDCPLYMRPHSDVWPCQCDCGRMAHICGACLVARRITGCPECGGK